MSYTELEHGYQVNSLFITVQKLDLVLSALVSNEILFAGPQECKQTDVLYRGHKYCAAVCYSRNLSFVEESKWDYYFTDIEIHDASIYDIARGTV